VWPEGLGKLKTFIHLIGGKKSPFFSKLIVSVQRVRV
jgi:hypothetical protein